MKQRAYVYSISSNFIFFLFFVAFIEEDTYIVDEEYCCLLLIELQNQPAALICV